MALTREFIRKLAKESDVELPKEFIDGIISEHTAARDAYAEEKVKEELAKHPEEIKVKETDEYKQLKKQFEDYKTDVEKKETHAAKEKALRELLKSAGVSEKRLNAVLRVSDVDGIELDESGKIKDAENRTETIKTEWADFIEKTEVVGANTANPPQGNTSNIDLGSLSMKDYIAARNKM